MTPSTFDVPISIFKNAQSVQPETVTIRKVLDAERSRYAERIAKIREVLHTQGEAAYNEVKKNLPGTTFSGTFIKRAADKIIQHSGFICLDFDKLPDMNEARKLLSADQYTASLFASPSGHGLKVLVRIPRDNHKASFKALERYYRDKYGLIVDPACSDVSRLCFVSYDPDLFSNENALVFPVDSEQESGEEAFIKAIAATVPRRANSQGDSVIQAWNDSNDILSMLLSLGYTQKGRMLCRPGAPDRYSVWIHEGKSFHHSSNDPLFSPENHMRDCFDVYRIMEHGGDEKATLRAAASILGIERKTASPFTSEKAALSGGETDVHLAEMISGRYGPDLRYCKLSNQWYCWDEKYWRPDESNKIFSVLTKVSRELMHEAGDEKDEKAQKALLTKAQRLLNGIKRNIVVRELSNLQELNISKRDLDRPPYLLNCANGTLDLETGKLRLHSRENMLTRLIPIDYIPGVQSRTWNDFLKRVIPDPDVRRYVQKAAGYSLTGDVGEEKLFFAYGPPATGKSTFLGAVKGVIGPYAKTMDFTSFLASKLRDTGPRSDIAGMEGYRFITSIEVEDGQKMAEGLLSHLTGSDVVSARDLHEKGGGRDIIPTWKIWFAANHRPDVSSGESALWRRLKLIPFDVEIPEAERDPNVKKILNDLSISGPAILAWLVEGCLIWRKEGLKDEPAAVRAMTEEYRTESDPLLEFFEERCVVTPADSYKMAGKQELYDAYLGYTETAKIRYAMSQKNFNKLLKGRGIQEKRIGTEKKRVWIGIELL